MTDTTPISSEVLRELRELIRRATRGPWMVRNSPIEIGMGGLACRALRQGAGHLRT